MNATQYPALWLRFIVSFFALAITLIVFAMTLGSIVQLTYFPEFLPGEGAESFGILFGGVAVMALGIALLYPRFAIQTGTGWFMDALRVGLLIGLTVFLSTHMIQAGYIKISPVGWLLEGLYDSTAPLVAVLVLAWMTQRKNKATTA
ncbi:MAG: hypothetical protein ACOYL5_19435 [Phototrophicaceae bacterium]|jgi:hypothetical protein